ncbi:sialate:O-sulfotransferase 2-like [Styela clava]
MLSNKKKCSLIIAAMALLLILTFSSKMERRTTLSALQETNDIDKVSTAKQATSTISTTEKPMSKSTKPKQPDTPDPDPVLEWESQTQPTTKLDPYTLRCKVRDMGCFIMVQQGQSVFGKIPAETSEVKLQKTQTAKEICFDSCFSNSYTLSAFNAAQKRCICSTRFEGFISNKRTRAAESYGAAQKCKAPSSFHVYSKIRDCEKGVSGHSLQQDRVGCMLIPERFNRKMIALSEFQISIEQCILNCEMRQFTYAVPIPQKSACLCSDSYSLFETVDNMTRIMSRCNDKTKKLKSDKEVEVFRTTVIDEHCDPLRFLLPRQNKPILLASYYGSGNTWIRHLIEVATGIYTGSVYNDIYIYEGGMLGEYLPDFAGRTIVVKDHLFKLKIPPHHTMAVLLIRNPYDATLAEFVRKKTRNHTGVIDNDIFRSPEFKRYASNRPDYWFGITNVVLKTFMEKVVVVYFEDLVKNSIKEMRRIVEFLPEEIVGSDEESFERRLMCMNLDLVGNFKRPPRKLNFDPFDAFIRNKFDKKIREMDDLLLEHNHPPLPDSYFLPY